MGVAIIHERSIEYVSLASNIGINSMTAIHTSNDMVNMKIITKSEGMKESQVENGQIPTLHRIQNKGFSEELNYIPLF